MTNFDRIPRFAKTFAGLIAMFLLATVFYTPVLRATSFSYSPDSVTFTPAGADSIEAYVRVAYTGDTSGPGVTIRAWISDGSSYFIMPTDTTHTTTYFYLRIVFHTQSDTVYGQLSISDDTTTVTVRLIGNPNPPPPVLSADGPYFPNIREGSDTCGEMRLVNTTGTPDTIRSVAWNHNPEGIFTWDSVSLPYILGAHDTVNWTFCFHAPDNTEEHIDTLMICCNTDNGCLSRVMEGTAETYDGDLSAVGPYFPENMREGTDTCVTMRLVNTSSTTDTVENISWSHSSDVFSWESTTVPFTLGAHDTTYLTFCYHAPDNTETYTDTISISYNDANGSGWYETRVVSEAAVTSDDQLGAEGPYFPTNIPEGKDTCVTMRLVNNGSGIDTVESIVWSHNSSGVFTWDSTTVPFILAAHDTTWQTICYHAPDNTETYTDTLIVRYNDANGAGWTDSRLVSATAIDTAPPDGPLDLYDGPYFPSVVDEGHDTCERMMVINSGDDLDTIVSVAWSHNPNGIFTWDSISIPFTMAAHDTSYWTFCFNAPDDTNLYIDTFTVRYHDDYSQDRYSTRIIEAKATDPNITTCYELYPTPNPAAVTNVGDTSYIHLFIRNNLSESSTLESVHFSGSDDGAFRADSSNFPTTIASNTYDSIWVMFIPNRTTGDQEYNATLTASFTTSDTADCRAATVSLSGYMPQVCSDTATINVDTTGSDDVDITGDSTTYYAHRIDVVNNTSSTIIVSAVRWLDSSSHFLITELVPVLPDTLAPGAGMAVIFHFYGDTGQVYYDTLALTIQAGIADRGGKFIPNSTTPPVIYVNVKGATTTVPATVAINAIPNSPELELYPNPSTGLVNMELEGAANATYEVMDILGQVIASHTGAGIWQWNASSATEAADGTYFVRAISSDASGNAVVTTKRLVLQR